MISYHYQSTPQHIPASHDRFDMHLPSIQPGNRNHFQYCTVGHLSTEGSVICAFEPWHSLQVQHYHTGLLREIVCYIQEESLGLTGLQSGAR